VCTALSPGAAASLHGRHGGVRFGELVFSLGGACRCGAARAAWPQGAYQGGWALVQSLSMGSALFLTAAERRIGWRGAWLL